MDRQKSSRKVLCVKERSIGNHQVPLQPVKLSVHQSEWNLVGQCQASHRLCKCRARVLCSVETTAAQRNDMRQCMQRQTSLSGKPREVSGNGKRQKKNWKVCSRSSLDQIGPSTQWIMHSIRWESCTKGWTKPGKAWPNAINSVSCSLKIYLQAVTGYVVLLIVDATRESVRELENYKEIE